MSSDAAVAVVDDHDVIHAGLQTWLGAVAAPVRNCPD
jgi:hypothetical protein